MPASNLDELLGLVSRSDATALTPTAAADLLGAAAALRSQELAAGNHAGVARFDAGFRIKAKSLLAAASYATDSPRSLANALRAAWRLDLRLETDGRVAGNVALALRRIRMQPAGTASSQQRRERRTWAGELPALLSSCVRLGLTSNDLVVREIMTLAADTADLVSPLHKIRFLAELSSDEVHLSPVVASYVSAVARDLAELTEAEAVALVGKLEQRRAGAGAGDGVRLHMLTAGALLHALNGQLGGAAGCGGGGQAGTFAGGQRSAAGAGAGGTSAAAVEHLKRAVLRLAQLPLGSEGEGHHGEAWAWDGSGEDGVLAQQAGAAGADGASAVGALVDDGKSQAEAAAGSLPHAAERSTAGAAGAAPPSRGAKQPPAGLRGSRTSGPAGTGAGTAGAGNGTGAGARQPATPEPVGSASRAAAVAHGSPDRRRKPA